MTQEYLVFENVFNNEVYMNAIAELLTKILEIFQSNLLGKNKLKAETEMLAKSLENLKHLEAGCACAIKKRYSELIFREIYKFEAKSHLHEQINDIYENSQLTRQQIKSGFPV